jgi:hypothetical protein
MRRYGLRLRRCAVGVSDLRNGSKVIFGGAAENVMGPSRGGNVDEGEAMVGRGVTERTVRVQGMERRDGVGITRTMSVGQPPY